ncbi:ankyrin repeat-containing domain protein [Coniochaeta sp. 2T2.1]|nr:ankyrin repeat-containing domain protein [Coniochaeta sp. 2T2.1]
MGDPLSAAASIVALLQLSGTVIGYLREIKNRDSPRLRSVLRSTEGVLQTLQETIEDAQLEPTETWSKTIRTLDGDEGPICQLSAALGSVNALLQRHASGPRKFLWPFKKGEVDELVQSIETQKLLLTLALENDHVALSKAIHRDIRDIGNDVSKLRVAQETSERRVLLDWLSTLDFNPQLHDFLSKREEGSGQWFLASAEYQKWKSEPRKTLICPGVPGAGKTIMASIAIEDLLHHHVGTKGTEPDIGMAYIFCSYQPQKVQRLEDLVSCLLKQLVQRSPDVPDMVDELYEKSLETGVRPPLKDMAKALQSTAERFHRVFIVVDALDELYVTDNDSLFQFLSILFELQKESSVNILATSRFNSEIISHFRQEASVKEIRADDGDVSRYIENRISGLLSSRISRYPALSQTVRDEVLKRVDGMFLLSRLHMDALASQPSVGHLKKALKELPKGLSGLDQTYENALQRITNQAPEQRVLAEKVLSWIYGAKRALSTAELQHAVAVDSDMDDLDRDFLPDVELLDALCAGLVTVDKEADVVRLVHYTTREFFERHVFLLGASQLLTRTCLAYISLDTLSHGVCGSRAEFDERLSKYELLTYAVTYWGEHLRDHVTTSTENDNSLSDIALRFLRKPELIGAAAQVLLIIEEVQITMRRIWLPPRMEGLHLAAYLGLHFLIDRLVANGQLPNVCDAGGLTPLAWAAVKGKFATARSLLMHMEPDSINMPDNSGRTPVSHAVMGGYQRVATLLLIYGADANLAGPGADTPLKYSIRRGRLSDVEYLINSGNVNLNSGFENNRPPLDLALYEGEFEIARALIRSGANVNFTDADEETYLHRAIRFASGLLVCDLINAGANLELQDRSGRTPLFMAIDLGKFWAAKTLLEAKVNVSTPSKVGLTPLMLCATIKEQVLKPDDRQSRMEIAKLILARGADPNERDPKGRTAMNKAAARGDTTMMELLMEYGADPENRESATGVSPLIDAAVYGHAPAVMFLLERGVDIETRTIDHGWTALSVAAISEHDEVLGILLEHGASVTNRDSHGLTPLMWAISRGLNTVPALLSHGGDRSPDVLHVACLRGATEVVEKLLGDGANPNGGSSCFDGWTPLMAAVYRGLHTIVSQLIDAGADVEAEIDGVTALKIAVFPGNKAMVQQLVNAGALVDAEIYGLSASKMAEAETHREIDDILLEASRQQRLKAESVTETVLTASGTAKPI